MAFLALSLILLGSSIIPANPTYIQSAIVVMETNTGQVAYFMQLNPQNIDLIELELWRNANQDNLYSFSNSNGVISITIKLDEFEDYSRTVTTESSFFYTDRTITLVCPYLRFFYNNPTAKLLMDFNTQFNDNPNTNIHLGYVFASSFRRSNVNADRVETDMLKTVWQYFFYIDPANPRDIIIQDRFANQSAWYLLAIGITAIATILLYLFFRYTNKRN